MFYALPVFKDIMSEEYYEHLMSLIIAINLLLQEKISPKNLAQATFLLEYFVNRRRKGEGRLGANEGRWRVRREQTVKPPSARRLLPVITLRTWSYARLRILRF